MQGKAHQIVFDWSKFTTTHFNKLHCKIGWIWIKETWDARIKIEEEIYRKGKDKDDCILTSSIAKHPKREILTRKRTSKIVEKKARKAQQLIQSERNMMGNIVNIIEE